MPISHKHQTIFIHIPKNAGTTITRQLEMDDFGHHEPLYYMQAYPQQWQEYNSFAIVRNPWDRVVSCYEYARMKKSYWHSDTGETEYGPHVDYHKLHDKSFEQCLDLLQRGELEHQGWSPQHLYTHINSQQVVDEIKKFENLSKELEIINPSIRKPYKEYYTSILVEKVRSIYLDDITLFGYSYYD